MIEATVVNRLLRWSRWKMQTGVQLGYPSQVSFVRLAPATTHFRDPGIDAENMLTENAYELLPMIHQSVIWVEYISTKTNYADKAHLFGGSPRRYIRCLNEAYSLLGNHLDILCERKEECA